MEALPQRPTPPRSPIERVRDWIEWFGLARLVVIAVSVLCVGAGGRWLLSPPPQPVEASLPMAVGAAGGSTTSAGAVGSVSTAPAASGGLANGELVETDVTTVQDIVVHVAGAVVVPGVYQLDPDARVIDAVAAAGGAAADAATEMVNLAAPLRDGDRIFLPRVDEVDELAGVPPGITPATPAAATPAASVPSGPIDVNTATMDQLDTLPGVGPSTAQAIVDHRNANGPFSSVDGLTDVRGIGPATLESLRPLVTV